MKLPTVRPEWRTATVVELCTSMREAQDFSAMPILADALQDAGCDDEELLARLRAGAQGWVQDVTTVALVMTEEAAGAVRKITEIGETIGAPYYNGDAENGSEDIRGEPLTYAVLLEAGKSANEEEWFFISMIHNEGYKGYFRESQFWELWQLITGVTPKDPEQSFFSCSC